MASFLAPSFSGYQRTSVRPDIIAGLAVWAVLVPESLAYATIAGVPPVVGLYAAVPALALYAIAGTSRQLVVSPMSATAALSAGIVASVAGADGDPVALTTALALATGIVAIIAGLLRLGFLAAFISEPVLKGFIIGLALTIMIGQVPDLIGVEGGRGSFFEKSWALLGQLGDIDPLTLVVGLASLVALVVVRRTMPFLPGSLVVVLLAIGAALLFGLGDRGLAVVGHIDAGLPRVGLPDVTGPQFTELLGGAVGLMLVGFAEGLGAAKTYAATRGYDVDPNRELVGLGISNLGSGVLSGMVVNGSLSKTAVNASAGARSQVSALTAAALTILTLLFLTGVFEQLPLATLAAVVVVAVVELVDVRSLRRLWRVRTGRLVHVYQVTARADFMAAGAALLGVLIFDTLPGLVIGIAVSLILLLARSSRPRITVLAPVGDEPGRPWVDAERNPGYPTVPGVLAVRVEGPLIFANAEYVRARLRELAAQEPGLRLVVLDGRATPSVDVTAAAMLVQLRGDLRRDGGDLALAEGIGQVRDVLARVGAEGEPPLFTTLDEAVRAGHDSDETA
ncbi:SulP family inorganic anion transporter [Promicromonospora iranensis]|uniref:High affinity sulfate transporter 1 n=1 Tax=Promicromonospora iranensis TaxID=1105144 RepID=A0ABU2CUM8_9MICO|nr:SulP family inorganic anion transporter [Promicromonospora iranensis]MDR7384991.1 high affinity sulfate transporter 1 [Promicromonospora iranensis]